MKLEDAKAEMLKFVKLKTSMRPAFVQPLLDAVEVVRCKDCKHRDPEDHKCDSGALERAVCVFPVADDYFCAWGERREDETD